MSAVIEEGKVVSAPAFSRPEDRSLPALPAGEQASPMAMLALAVQRGMDPTTIKGLMDLSDRFEATQAKKAFNEAFANFKAEVILVVKNRTVDAGPLKDKKYAELFSVVNAVTPALSKHGLSASWHLSKDEKDWIEVTCTIKHAMGHSEAVSMGGPPDDGGAKSKIQARASTVSYLERYTLKAICGVAEQGDDNDGNGGRRGMDEGKQADFLAAMEACTTLPELQKSFSAAYKAAEEAKDQAAQKSFIRAKDTRKAALTKKGGEA